MKLHTEYGDYNVDAYKDNYGNGNTAVLLIDQETGEEVVMMTVNLVELPLPEHAYIDTNNFPEAVEFIKENELGKPLGPTRQSGFCEYPLYELDLDKLKEWEDA